MSCPRGTAWCTDHEHEADQCVSPSFDVESSSIWLVQEIPGIEPQIAVDSSGTLSLARAADLRDALYELRSAAIDERPVQL